MEPLQAFQALTVATAAALVPEALRAATRTAKAALFAGIIALGLVAIFADMIADAWPAAAASMFSLAANPLTWFILVVAVYSWFRPRWIRPPDPALPPSASAAEEKVKSLEERIALLEAEPSGYPNAAWVESGIEIIHDRLNKLETEQRKLAEIAGVPPKLTLLADCYEARERYYVLKERLERLRASLPKPPKDDPRRQDLDHAKAWDYYYTEFNGLSQEFNAELSSLRRLGFNINITEAVQTEVARIMQDAAYLSILPEDAEFMWRTGEEKRKWYLREAPLRVQVAIFEADLVTLYEKSEFVRRLAQG